MTHHPFHQTKFRWTENLTSRFIQLRKENGNLFTGRKYSAQAGWEHILQQMRREFPTIMADVHYRVLKKKWSNLLQQYKELKNPVHGDRNKSDDVSWPFYGAIDEVLSYGSHRQRSSEDADYDSVNLHEFLCLSVNSEEPASSPEEIKQRNDSEIEIESNSVLALQRRIRNLRDDFSIEIEKLPRTTIRRPGPRCSRQSQIAEVLMKCQEASEVLVSRLPPATELSIKTVRSSSSSSSSLPKVSTIRVKDFSKERIRDSTTTPLRTAAPRQIYRNTLTPINKRNGIHRPSSAAVVDDVEEVEEDDDDDGEEVEEDEEEDRGEEVGQGGEEEERLQGGGGGAKKRRENEVVAGEEEEIEEIEEDDEDELVEEDEEEDEEREEEEEEGEELLDEVVRIRPRKIRRIERPTTNFVSGERERGLERRLDQFIEYTKRRDEENRQIMTRILNAVEKIADKQ